MTKTDLIKALSNKQDLTEKDAAIIVDLIFDGFIKTLKKGGRIEIRGFGNFVVREYKAYKGRNPKTGTNIDVKPKRAAFFKVGKELKNRLY